MTTDYQRIRKDNIKVYGTGTTHLAFLGQLYSDRTHFIFELLQNAEDAGASRVSFALFHDRLEVRHDGRPFDERDVRGICGVQEGTKAKDFTQIGRFGVGFKSVYAYTQVPHIYSGDEHFRIEHYVRPQWVRERRLQAGWTTLFVFPFDRPEIPATQAFEEIGKRLSTLGARTILFLRHIRAVEWSIAEGPRGGYSRETVAADTEHDARSARLTTSMRGRRATTEDWLIFERALGQDGALQRSRVEAAFLLEWHAGQETATIARATDAKLVVFFPTEKETHLGFLVQGPFQTTPARDNIPTDNAWNQGLVRDLAALVVDALAHLRDMGLLNVGVLETMPLRPADFPPENMFRPIFDQVRIALRTMPLLPTHDGGFTAGLHAKLARRADLADLLSAAQLRALFGLGPETNWLSNAIGEMRTPDLYRYLVGQRGVGASSPEAAPLARDIEVRPEAVVRQLGARFLAQQETGWFILLYRFLRDQRDLWPRLHEKPILRLADGRQVALHGENGRPAAYLPPSSKTSYPTIDPAIVADSAAHEFLVSFGVRTPDVVAELLDQILPRYARTAGRGLRKSEHAQHLEKIAAALRTASREQQDLLLKELRGVAFVRSSNALGGSRAYRTPGQVYARTEALIQYFAGNKAAWFLDDEEIVGDERTAPIWAAVGIRALPRLEVVLIDLSPRERLQLRENGPCSQDQTPTDRRLDGLDHWLDRQERRRGAEARKQAQILWNFLQSYLAEGVAHGDQYDLFKSEYRWRYYSERRTTFDAQWLKQLKTRSWLPARGGLRPPSELSLDQLPKEFARDRALADVLQMRPDVVGTLVSMTGMSVTYLDYMRQHTKQIMAFIDRQKTAGKATERPATYADALESTLNTGRPQVEDAQIAGAATVAANPERRRDKTRAELERSRNEEPDPDERFALVATKAWEGKDSGVRAFLFYQYAGHCQICQSTFPKRDGEPYFEARYLVSYMQARWLDRPGNALCLCATCSAKFAYGAVSAESIVQQIETFRTAGEGGAGSTPALRIMLCGEPVAVYFTEAHLIDLQEMLRSDTREGRIRA